MQVIVAFERNQWHTHTPYTR